MPLIIPNTTLLDAYDKSTTFAGSDVFAGGYFTIANNPAAVELGIGPHGQAAFGFEQFLPPGTYPIVPGGPQRSISGIRARNFIAGSPVQFFGGLVYPNEPSIQAGTPYTGVIASNGAVGGLGEVEFTQIFADVAVVGVNPAGATPVINGTIRAYEAVRTLVEFYTPQMQSPGPGVCAVGLWDGAAFLQTLGVYEETGGGNTGTPVFAAVRFTPVAGNHQYNIRAWSPAANGTINAGPSLGGGDAPAFMRISVGPQV